MSEIPPIKALNLVASINALEEWLHKLLLADTRLAGIVREVHTIPGLPDGSSEQLEKVLRSFFIRLPALGTYFPSGKWSTDDPNFQIETNTAWILCAAANARKPGAPLRGDNDQVGAWDLLEHTRRAVTNKVPDLNISHCAPLSWRLLWSNAQLAVCALAVDISYIRPLPVINKPDGWTGQFER